MMRFNIIIRNKAVLGNILSLQILNALNMFLPLVSIPYLISTIGSANYGAYSISYTILQYVLLIGAFGFGCTTTREISQHRDDIVYVSRLFFSTLFARVILTIIASFAFLFVVLVLFPQYIILYLFGLGIVFGDILNPVWLYQGMEDMKYMTIVNAIAKTIFTFLIFVFIKCSDDYIYITLLNSAGFIIAGIVSFIIAIRKFNIEYSRICIKDIIFQVKNASVVFFSSAFVSLYNNSFVFIMGLFLSESSVGIYAAVEKIIKAARSIVEPISTALFPHVSKLFIGRTEKENVSIIYRYLYKIAIPLVLISLCVFIFAPFACRLVLSSIADECIFLIRLMSPLIMIGGLNYMLGIVGLINLGKQKDWFVILLLSSSSSILFLLLLVSKMDILAAIIASYVAELMIFFSCCFTLKKICK